MSTIAVYPKNEPLPTWRIESPVDIGSDLWINSKFKDFQIVIDDRVIDVHKCVLAVRSPVFSAMFTSGLIETQTGQLVIQDFDFDTVQNVIWLLYTQRFATNYSTTIICDMLRFGHKYDIQHLINTCLRQIEDLKNKYDSSEIKFLIKSAEDLGSDQILNTIMIIFERKYDLNYFPTTLEIIDALFQDESFKDLKIISAGRHQFSAHKCILALKSPIFAQMLDTLADNGDTSGRLIINHIKPLVVKYVVGFFYTGRMAYGFYFKCDLVLGLLVFADRFKVERLASVCLQRINEVKKNVDTEAISNFIQTAGNFESKKIFHYILGIFETKGFELWNFDFKKASSESYWN